MNILIHNSGIFLLFVCVLGWSPNLVDKWSITELWFHSVKLFKTWYYLFKTEIHFLVTGPQTWIFHGDYESICKLLCEKVVSICVSPNDSLLPCCLTFRLLFFVLSPAVPAFSIFLPMKWWYSISADSPSSLCWWLLYRKGFKEAFWSIIVISLGLIHKLCHCQWSHRSKPKLNEKPLISHNRLL